MPKDKGSVRILITDDHTIFRDGLRRLLESEPGLRVAGEAANGEEALHQIEKLRPDLLLMDLAMPGLPGLAVLTRVASNSPHPKVIVVTAANDPSQIIRALQLGANGIVLKESATRVLFESIRCVMAGGCWVGESPTEDLVETLRSLSASVSPTEPSHDHGLTDRELQIVSAISAGSTNKEIAAKFSISEHTVKNHLTNIFDKLGVSNRLELGLFALSKRLIKQQDDRS